MLRVIFLGGFLLLVPAHAQVSSQGAQERLQWAYARFVSNFEQRAWSQVYRAITPQTSLSFGGASGRAGFDRIYKNNPACFRDMLLALKQGCRLRSGKGPVECVAPPQWNKPGIIYLGARAVFKYNPESDELTATYLICGGD